MRRRSIFIISLVITSSAIVVIRFYRGNKNLPPPELKPALHYQTLNTISTVVSQPEEKVDVALAALVFAKEVYPHIDISSYSARIDVLAGRVRELAQGTVDPERRVRCLNTVLLLSEKFQGTRELAIARRPEMYYLNRVLETKKGNCVSMPLLYIAVAQRLGWPVHMVHLPDHAFVRYADPFLKEQNIETTSSGGFVPDDVYARDFLVGEKGIRMKTYLHTLTHRESLSDLAAINGVTFARRSQTEKAIDNLELAIRLNPRNAAALRNLIIAYKAMAKKSQGEETKKYLELAARGSKKLDELGFTHPNDIPQFSFKRRLT